MDAFPLKCRKVPAQVYIGKTLHFFGWYDTHEEAQAIVKKALEELVPVSQATYARRRSLSSP